MDKHGWSPHGDARPSACGMDGSNTASTGATDAHLRGKLLGNDDGHPEEMHKLGAQPVGDSMEMGAQLWHHALWEDLRTYVRTTQHAMDMLAYQDRQWHQMVTQLEETFLSHVELTKAVNVLLSEMAARMPRTAMAILEQVKELKELLQTLATLPTNVGKVLEQVGNFKDLLEAGFARIATPATTQDMGGSHTLVVEKTKETLARVELLDKNLEKVHAKLGAVATTLVGQDPTKAHNELAKPALEKIETFCRAKFLSLHEEVGLNRGQASTLHKDKVVLLKSMEKTPVDSAGQTRALDMLMAMSETQREHAESIERYDQAMGEFKEASREHVQKTQDLGAVIFELRDRFIDQFGARLRQFSTYAGPQLQPVNRGPTVIDLQSRIADSATQQFRHGHVPGRQNFNAPGRPAPLGTLGCCVSFWHPYLGLFFRVTLLLGSDRRHWSSSCTSTDPVLVSQCLFACCPA